MTQQSAIFRRFLVAITCAASTGAAGGTADVRALEIADQRPLQEADAGLLEPSGLSLDPAVGGFWTVSDSTEKLFRLGSEGELRDASAESDALKGLEGITADPARNRVLAISEDRAEIVVVPLGDTGQIERIRVADIPGIETVRPTVIDRRGNNGFEGIAMSPDGSTLFIVKERDPRLLLELDGDIRAVRAVHTLTAAAGLRKHGIKDHDLDIAGIAFDPVDGFLWLVSDTGGAVFLWDKVEGTALGLDLRDGQGKHIGNGEGIAVSPDGTTLFVVTDDGDASAFYRFHIDRAEVPD